MAQGAPSFWDEPKPPGGGASDFWKDESETPPAPVKPTTADNAIERAAPKPYYGFTPGNMASNAWEGAKGLTKGGYEMGKDVLFPKGNTEGERLSYLSHKYITDPAEAENKKAQNSKSGLESFGHSVAAGLPIVGPWAASIGEQAGTGDVGGAVAKGATQYGLGAGAAKLVPRFIPKVEINPSEVGAGLAEGKVRGVNVGAPPIVNDVAPAVRFAGRQAPVLIPPAVGAIGGSIFGHPAYGAMSGLAGEMFPKLTDAIREHPWTQVAREFGRNPAEILGDQLTDGPVKGIKVTPETAKAIKSGHVNVDDLSTLRPKRNSMFDPTDPVRSTLQMYVNETGQPVMYNPAGEEPTVAAFHNRVQAKTGGINTTPDDTPGPGLPKPAPEPFSSKNIPSEKNNPFPKAETAPATSPKPEALDSMVDQLGAKSPTPEPGKPIFTPKNVPADKPQGNALAPETEATPRKGYTQVKERLAKDEVNDPGVTAEFEKLGKVDLDNAAKKLLGEKNNTVTGDAAETLKSGQAGENYARIKAQGLEQKGRTARIHQLLEKHSPREIINASKL